MSVTRKSNSFFLISFLPAVAYWYLESHFSLQIALAGGVALALLELLAEWVFFKHVHAISRINFGLIAALGGLALLGQDGLWFKLQPLLTGVGLGGILLVQNLRQKSLMGKMVQEFSQRPPPPALVELLERHMALFMIGYGLFMGAVAIWWSTHEWLFFKTIGFYLAFAGFFVGELVYLRRKLRY